MKHAYLILAHNNRRLLEILIGCLDDCRNDIYLHWDKKSGEVPALSTKHAKLIILEERIDVRWADISVLKAEFLLLDKALSSNDSYAYLHLLSGQDLPLKSQDEIHAFFENNVGLEFVQVTEMNETPEIIRKAHRYHLFPRHFRSKSLLIRCIRSLFLRMQEVLGIRRNNDILFKKGGQWFSITPELATYFCAKQRWNEKTFHHTFCPDELSLQTVIWNSPFREKISSRGHMRMINWENGCLYDWKASDYEQLANTQALFARKFNLDDMDFIQKVLALSVKDKL